MLPWEPSTRLLDFPKDKIALFEMGFILYRFPTPSFSGNREDFPIMGIVVPSPSQLRQTPFSLEELFEYYQVCGFTHGVSLDCVISDKNPKWDDVRRLPSEIDARGKYTLKQKLAVFLQLHREKKRKLHTHWSHSRAWSPKLSCDHARKLVDMGYGYLGLGGVAQLLQVERLSIYFPRSVPIFQTMFAFMSLALLALPHCPTLGLGIELFDSSSPCSKRSRMISPITLSDGRSYLAIRLPAMSELFPHHYR